jgi:hypothetical protein
MAKNFSSILTAFVVIGRCFYPWFVSYHQKSQSSGQCCPYKTALCDQTVDPIGVCAPYLKHICE